MFVGDRRTTAPARMAHRPCFAPSVPLDGHRSAPWRENAKQMQCTLVPGRTYPSRINVGSEPPVRVHRVLPANLPKSQRPPSPPVHASVPWIGFFLEEALGVNTESYEKSEKYGPIYYSSFLLGPHIYLSDYQGIIDALRDVDVFRSEGAFEMFKDLFGEDTMIANDFALHAKTRHAVAPAFTPSLFPYYFDKIRMRVDSTWERVLAKAAAGKEVIFADEFRQHFLSIAIELTTGVDMNSTNAAKILDKFKRLQLAFFTPKFGPLWNSCMSARDEILDILAGVVRQNLKERADTIEKLREYGEDIIKLGAKEIATGEVDSLLVLIANSSLSTEPGADIDEEVVAALCRPMLLLWTAGYQTAAVTSMCSSFEMGLDETIYEKLLAEQDAIVAAAGGDVTVTYQQTVEEMPLFDSFMMEILRMHPAAPSVSRKVAKDVEILGYFVPQGTRIFLDIQAAHRDAKLYPDPHTLKVDRFHKKQGDSKPPALLAFGAPGSAHYCIGSALAKAMVKCTFATLLREYTYALKAGQTRRYDFIPDAAPSAGVVVDMFKRRERA